MRSLHIVSTLLEILAPHLPDVARHLRLYVSTLLEILRDGGDFSDLVVLQPAVSTLLEILGRERINSRRGKAGDCVSTLLEILAAGVSVKERVFSLIRFQPFLRFWGDDRRP